MGVWKGICNIVFFFQTRGLGNTVSIWSGFFNFSGVGPQVVRDFWRLIRGGTCTWGGISVLHGGITTRLRGGCLTPRVITQGHWGGSFFFYPVGRGGGYKATTYGANSARIHRQTKPARTRSIEKKQHISGKPQQHNPTVTTRAQDKPAPSERRDSQRTQHT